MPAASICSFSPYLNQLVPNESPSCWQLCTLKGREELLIDPHITPPHHRTCRMY